LDCALEAERKGIKNYSEVQLESELFSQCNGLLRDRKIILDHGTDRAKLGFSLACCLNPLKFYYGFFKEGNNLIYQLVRE
jgi:hypothetical protein